MANASSATHTCAHARLFGSAMSATTAHSREGVWSVESASQTPTTARSVPSRRRTRMVVPRLSILEAPRLISSTSGRSMGLRRDDWVAGFYWPRVVFRRTDTEIRLLRQQRCIRVMIWYWCENTPLIWYWCENTPLICFVITSSTVWSKDSKDCLMHMQLAHDGYIHGWT